MRLKDLPADAQPREKLLALGVGSLSDTELLALLLRTGTQREGVLQMADKLLDRYGRSLANLLHATPGDLKEVHGLGGDSKRSQLIAVLELARRAMAEELKRSEVFGSPEAVKNFLQLHLAHRKHEVFAALFLDAQNRLIELEELFRGTLRPACTRAKSSSGPCTTRRLPWCSRTTTRAALCSRRAPTKRSRRH
jgi:DNA repair protein RadC